MKEDKARNLWCPMVRLAVTEKEAPARNRHPNKTWEGCNCIASDCALWVSTNAGKWELPNGAPAPSDARTPEQVGAIWVGEGRCGLINNHKGEYE